MARFRPNLGPFEPMPARKGGGRGRAASHANYNAVFSPAKNQKRLAERPILAPRGRQKCFAPTIGGHRSHAAMGLVWLGLWDGAVAEMRKCGERMQFEGEGEEEEEEGGADSTLHINEHEWRKYAFMAQAKHKILTPPLSGLEHSHPGFGHAQASKAASARSSGPRGQASFAVASDAARRPRGVRGSPAAQLRRRGEGVGSRRRPGSFQDTEPSAGAIFICLD
ncbi:uncharacterized protein VTP21DRAFT_6418 [Calcarisporiella thermophila]|uniref:uncharacterized protein n=1 Tax=Calcarisporiella thermophila TaxID=911321 RepID=UPI003742974D